MPDYAGLTIEGEDAFGDLGREVANAGDINGDGIADFIVSAPYFFSSSTENGVASYSGATYVVFGTEDGATTLDVGSLDGTNGFQISAREALDATGNDSANFQNVGSIVAGLGDVNGDGIGDILVAGDAEVYGGYGPGGAYTRTSFIYVLFGRDTTQGNSFAAVESVAGLDGTTGFAIDGVDGLITGAESQVDVNGDGLGDIVIGQSPVPINQGYGYYYGPVDAVQPVPGDAAPQAALSPGGEYAGFVILGEANLGGTGNGDGVVSVNELDGTNGFGVLTTRSEVRGGIEGGLRGTYGGGLTNLGDVNGDGFDDLLVREVVTEELSPFDFQTTTLQHIIFGRDNEGPGLADTFTAAIDPDAGGADGDEQVFWPLDFEFTYSDTQFYHVAGIGDVNGDGFDDVAVSIDNLNSVTVGNDTYTFDTGPVHILFGGPNGIDSDPTDGINDGLALSVPAQGPLEAGAGFTIFTSELSTDFDRFGFDVAAAGDVTGDGIDDFLISAPFRDLPDGAGGTISDAGNTFLIFGRDTDGADPAFDRFIDLNQLSTSEFSALGYRFNGIDAADDSGTAISGIGDFNNDGINDFAITAPDADPNGRSSSGEAYIIHGGQAMEIADLADGVDDNVIQIANLDVDVDTGLVPIEISFSNPSAFLVQDEGTGGTTSYVYDVVRTGDVSLGVSVDFTVSGSGFRPANAADFAGGLLPTGTVTFASGDATAQVSVVVAGDAVQENTEDFSVTLSNPLVTGTAPLPTIEVLDGTAFGRIGNDDFDPEIFLTGGGSITEGDSGTRDVVFTINRRGDTTGEVEIEYSLNPRPTPGDFFAADSNDIVGVLPSFGNVVTMADGQATLDVVVQITGDTIIEPRESFSLDINSITALQAGDSYAIGSSSRFATIRNDDGRPPVIPPGVEADVFGDPHIVTLDGLGYDFQAVGEYVLVETVPGDSDPFQVQVRFEALPGSELVSVTTRMAVEVGGVTIELDALGADELLLDGVATTVDLTIGAIDIDGDGTSDLFFDGDAYTIVLNDLNEQLQIKVMDGSLNVCVFLADPATTPGGHAGQVRGLMGNADGDFSNDFALRDGSAIPAGELTLTNGVPSLSFDFLYGRGEFGTGGANDGESYADSWTVPTAERLFTNTAIFPDGFPVGVITLDDLPAATLAAARQAALDSGLDPNVVGEAVFEAAILDFALTGDDDFLQGALGLAAEPEVTTEPDSAPALPASFGVTPSTTTLVEGDSGSTTVMFEFFRAGDTTTAATLNISVGGDVDGSDLASGTSLSQTVSFAIGDTSQQISIDVLGDQITELDEDLVVTIDSISGDPAALIAGPTAAITIENDDSAPVAVDDTIVVDENTPAMGAVLGNDSDADGDTLSVIAINGSASFTGGITLASGAVLTIGSDGTFSYDASGAPGDVDGFDALAAGDVDSDSFTYTVSDGNGNSDTGDVQITINGENDAPSARDDEGETTEDTSTAIAVLDNDSDGEGNTLLITAINGASVTDGDAIDLTLGGVTLTGGTLVFDPTGDFESLQVGNDAIVDLTYTVSDGLGGTDDGAVSVTVTGVNDAPVAEDDSAVSDGSPVQIAVLDNDSDVESDPLSIASFSDGANGSVSLLGVDLIYTPDARFSGEDTFTYRVTDPAGPGAVATVTVAVDQPNEAPEATDDVFSIDQDGDLVGNLILADNGNGTDSDLDGDTLSVIEVRDSGGNVIPTTASTAIEGGGLLAVGTDGAVFFDPNGDFDALLPGTSVDQTFTYIISDGQGETDLGTVTITINGVDDTGVIIVDTLDDVVDAADGVTSLREAILEANETAGDDIIEIDVPLPLALIAEPSPPMGPTILIENGLMEITENVEILGNGTVLDAQLQSGIFSVADNVGVSMENISLTNGAALDGGAINGGDGVSLDLTNVILWANNAEEDGGAIALGQEAAVSLIESGVFYNMAGDDGGAVSVGDGSSVASLGSMVLGNVAFDRGGFVSGRDGLTLDMAAGSVVNNLAAREGGAVFARDDALVTIDGTILSANAALKSGGLIDLNDNADVTISDAIISGNIVLFAGGALAFDDDALVDISGSEISGNITEVFGGFLFADDRADVSITDSFVADNSAGIDGGALYFDRDATLTIGQSTIAGNTSGRDGGAIALDDNGVVSIDESFLLDNGTLSRFGDGGAIYVDNGAAEITIANTSATGNSAGGDGGVIGTEFRYGAVLDVEITGDAADEFSNNSAGDDGGVIFAADDALIFIDGVTVANNEAADFGGVIALDDDGNVLVTNVSDPLASGNTAGDGGDFLSADDDLIALINGTSFDGDNILV